MINTKGGRFALKVHLSAYPLQRTIVFEAEVIELVNRQVINNKL